MISKFCNQPLRRPAARLGYALLLVTSSPDTNLAKPFFSQRWGRQAKNDLRHAIILFHVPFGQRGELFTALTFKGVPRKPMKQLII